MDLCQRNVAVLVEMDCAKCGGTGSVQPDYDLYSQFTCWQNEWMLKHPVPSGAPELGIVWRKSRDEAEDNWWTAAGFPGGPACWPAQSVSCDACAGEGREEMRIGLSEFAQLVLEVSKDAALSEDATGAKEKRKNAKTNR